MKALTIMQPWASLIAVGAKSIETRPWHPQENPGTIAIASSMKPMSLRLRELAATPAFAEVLPAEPPVGSIIAVGRLKEFRRVGLVDPEDLTGEQHFGDFSDGRWAWYFDKVKALEEPIRIPPSRPGEKKAFRLNLWDLPRPLITPAVLQAALVVGMDT